MHERIDSDTPAVIKEWLLFPYVFFTEMISKSSDFHLLDMAAGNNLQNQYLRKNWKSVLALDYQETVPGVGFGDILNIPLNDNAVDWGFSFETIEHLPESDHARMMTELYRVCTKGFIIGSVNKSGPAYLNDVEIWKNGKNPFHQKEYDHIEWSNRFSGMTFFHSRYENNRFFMESGIDVSGVSNYAMIEHEKI